MPRLGRFTWPARRSTTVTAPRLPLRRAKVPTAPSTAHVARGVILALILALGTAAALSVSAIVTRTRIREGDVAQVTIRAPRDISFVDERATDRLRHQVAESVPILYTTSTTAELQAQTLVGALLDTATGMQYERLGLRNFQMRVATLVRISQDSISASLATQLLRLSPEQLSRMKEVVDAALVTAGHGVLREADLVVARRNPTFPSPAQSGTMRAIATQLFADFLRANRVVDSAATTRAQQLASSAIAPVQMVFRKNEAIVEINDQVSHETFVALQLAGATMPELNWQDVAANCLIGLLAAGLLHGYLISIKSSILVRPRRILLLDTMFLATTVAAVLLLEGHGLLPYVFPAAMLGMLITTLLSAEVSVVATVLWALLAGWYLGSSLEIGTYFLTTGLTGALLVRDVRRSGEFFVASFWTAVVGLVTILAFKLLDHGYDWLGLGTYSAAVLVSAALDGQQSPGDQPPQPPPAAQTDAGGSGNVPPQHDDRHPRRTCGGADWR